MGKKIVQSETKTDRHGLIPFFRQIAADHPDPDSILFLCIGTDRSTGDAYGPLVGTMLQRQGWSVLGTLEHPCDADTLRDALREAERYSVVIAVDACLGKPGSAGMYRCRRGPLRPGEATSAGLPPIGHYSVAGIVGENGPKPYWILQTASLHRVIQMAEHTAEAVEAAWHSASIADYA
ncbi:spore protease YyaC [Paenibacillus thailandensis]|uniref:Spore protease YyaC n=1 Tax=Paenibacillus thailandensis TaxID=393250 RepID=A0ABW5QV41_9BACL